MYTRMCTIKKLSYIVCFFALFFAGSMLAGCITDVWTGATLIYDRHNIYKKISDFQLSADASRALYQDRLFKGADCTLDLAIFNGDILLSGHVPTDELRKEAQSRMTALKGYRRFFNQLAVAQEKDHSLQDNWITTRIRSEIFTDANIDPHTFKVITTDQIVYLMGDVIPKEAAIVIQIARRCPGVKRVVKLLKYYNLSDKPEK